jgi:hypothetical protein
MPKHAFPLADPAAADGATAPSLAVVVPATDDPSGLRRCLEAVRASTPPPDELVIQSGPAGAGPALARNLGADAASAELVVFVDADVAVHPDALARISGAFAADPELTAVFGSYDDRPEAPGAVSRFRNLLHHHVHSTSAGAAETFWAGLGGIRRDAFLASGGFDADRFPAPAVEDVELGMRLRRVGARIVLDPAIRGTHLKCWSLAGMVRTDIASRGVPWVRLQLEAGERSTTLNLAARHRASALASLAVAAGVLGRRPVMAAISAATLVGINHGLYSLLLRRGGPRLAAAGLPLHVVHHLSGVVSVPVALALHFGQRRGRARTVGDRSRGPDPIPVGSSR